MGRTKLCSPSKHVWYRVDKRDPSESHDICEICGTRFPCLGCLHADCESARELGIETWEKEGVR